VSARRFFVEGAHAAGDVVEIAGSDAHKIVRVLRLREGDAFEIVDSSGALFVANVSAAGATVKAELLRVVDGGMASRLQIDVAQAVPKGQKMDFIVEKATELGMSALLPFYSERTVSRDVGGVKIERWRRLAKAAAQQCGRRNVPHVGDAIASFDALLARFPEYDAVLFPWELAPRVPLRERLPELLGNGRRALVVIGPEGGFSQEEAVAAQARGAALLWLGSRILRTETAAMALLAVIDALVDDSGERI
jgi:16S rRNA (uracil1498-N3)-methyltransferase